MHFSSESFRKDQRDIRGFSFIELVIVVAVIGILTAIAVPSYGAIQNNAKQAAVDSNAKNGYKQVAASLVGLNAGKSAVEELAKLENEVIGLELQDSTGAVLAQGASVPEDFCVYAYNKNEKIGDDYRYSSFEGSCATTAPVPTPTPETPGEEEQPGETAQNFEALYTPNFRAEYSNQALQPLSTRQRFFSDQNIAFNKDVAIVPYNRYQTNNNVYTYIQSRSEGTFKDFTQGATRGGEIAVYDGFIYQSFSTTIVRSPETVGTSAEDRFTIAGSTTRDNLEFSKKGELYFTSSRGVEKINLETRTQTIITARPNGETITSMALGTDVIYMATAKGLYIYDSITDEVAKVSDAAYVEIQKAENGIYAAQGNRLYRVSDSGVAEELTTITHNGSAFTIATFGVAPNGDLWVRSTSEILLMK